MNVRLIGLTPSRPSHCIKIIYLVTLFLNSEFELDVVNCGLSEIGYKEPEDKDLDYVHDEEQSLDNSHIFIRFENDRYIRVYSDLIDFEVSMKS